jgi:hypothetical protein
MISEIRYLIRQNVAAPPTVQAHLRHCYRSDPLPIDATSAKLMASTTAKRSMPRVTCELGSCSKNGKRNRACHLLLEGASKESDAVWSIQIIGSLLLPKTEQMLCRA